VPPPQEDFIPAGHTKSVAQAYAGVETHRLENAVRFPSSEALLNWWRNHNSHVASADSAVAQVVAEYFAAHREFRLTKNVLGVLFHA